jgi:chromosomal replication initiation ATPase DnaA
MGRAVLFARPNPNINSIHTMPKIAELTNYILGIVAEELDVPQNSILSKSRKAEIVDARHMVAKLLHIRNIYPSRIAEIFGVSPRTVQYVITSFDARIQTNRALRNSYAKLAKRLGENCETTAK